LRVMCFNQWSMLSLPHENWLTLCSPVNGSGADSGITCFPKVPTSALSSSSVHCYSSQETSARLALFLWFPNPFIDATRAALGPDGSGRNGNILPLIRL